MKKEIAFLMARDCFRIINKKSLPSEPNILGERFVMAIKKVGKSEDKVKARYVFQGHREK